MTGWKFQPEDERYNKRYRARQHRAQGGNHDRICKLNCITVGNGRAAPENQGDDGRRKASDVGIFIQLVVVVVCVACFQQLRSIPYGNRVTQRCPAGITFPEHCRILKAQVP